MKLSGVFFFLALAGLAPPVWAQPPGSEGPPTLTVSGEGKSEVKPDFARVSVSVSTTAAALADAGRRHQDVARRARSLLEGLKEDGVAIERADFTLSQDQPPAPANPPSPPEFTAKTTFSLTIRPIDRLDSALSKVAGSGLLSVDSVAFNVDRPNAALDQARRAAMIDARRQAEVYADAGGFRLVAIEAVSGAQAFPLERQPLAMRAQFAPASVQIVPPALLAFSSSVTVVWRIAPR